MGSGFFHDEDKREEIVSRYSMLKAERRLTRDKDFKLVFKKGRTFENEFLRIKFSETGPESSRFGFVVSKKISNKASQRNLLKRRLRAAVKFLLPKVKPGFDVIVWPKASLKGKKIITLESSLESILSRSKLLK